jgi:hypothetical protein
MKMVHHGEPRESDLGSKTKAYSATSLHWGLSAICGGRSRRAGVLLETLLAVTILVAAGTTIIAAADRGERLLRSARSIDRAADLARSLLAAVEVGLLTPQNAPAAVRTAPDGSAWLALDTDATGSADALAPPTLRAEISAEPTAHLGLARLTVTITPNTPNSGDSTSPLFTLTQLIRLPQGGPP